MVQYGEFVRWSLVGVKVCLSTNSPSTIPTFIQGRLGELRSGYLGLKGSSMDFSHHLTTSSRGCLVHNSWHASKLQLLFYLPSKFHLCHQFVFLSYNPQSASLFLLVIMYFLVVYCDPFRSDCQHMIQLFREAIKRNLTSSWQYNRAIASDRRIMLSNWRTVIRHADLEPPEKEQNVHVCNKHTIVIIYLWLSAEFYSIWG